VGSLPAFANFCRKYVAESSIYRIIQARFFSSKGSSTYEWQPKDEATTFGGGRKERKKPTYYELSGGSTFQSKVTVPGEAHMAEDDRYNDGIMRTIGVAQEEHKIESVDRLV
jgi:hypothetical protein